MSDGLSRRDFLNGAALAAGAGLAWSCAKVGAAGCGAPPVQLATSLEGGSGATLTAAHALRDGHEFILDGIASEDELDLVIVGAGLSSLAAAYFYRQREPSARILLLENQADFGGHARRCEMHVEGRLILGYGGSESIQSPKALWSARAGGLLRELGVDLARFERYFDRELYPSLGLSRGVFFTREAFGEDKLVTGDPTRMVADDVPAGRLHARTPAAFIGDFPLPPASRAGLVALYTEARDVLPGKSREEKTRILATLSYRAFLTQCWRLDEKSADVFQKRSHDFFAIGIDGVPALEAAAAGYPGFAGLGLEVSAEAQAELEEPYIYHFPDGNASIARLLVRRLVPSVAPGSSMEDIVLAPFDFTRLDAAGSNVRIRLNSTVVVLRGDGERGVDVGYLREGRLRRVRARNVIHGGYNMMLPYMDDALAAPQRAALAACVKAPLVYAKVALRNWEPWAKRGVHEITNPMGFFSRIKLDYPVSLGGYRSAKSPREPIGLHLVHVPTPGGTGLDQRAAWRLGRSKLLATPYQEFERNVFDELTRIFGPAGFDAKRDIAAVHIYRWGHGYAYGFNSLYDKPQTPELTEVARTRVGRIAIANSDAGWSAYAHSAIDQAARAVDELRGA